MESYHIIYKYKQYIISIVPLHTCYILIIAHVKEHNDTMNFQAASFTHLDKYLYFIIYIDILHKYK